MHAQIKRNKRDQIKVKTKLGYPTEAIKMGKEKKHDEKHDELRVVILSLQTLKYFLSLWIIFFHNQNYNLYYVPL